MKLKIIAFIILIASVFSFSGCSLRTNNVVKEINEHSTLEIELLTPFSECNFSDYEVGGGYGVTAYIKYTGTEPNEMGAKPHIKYSVSKYPYFFLGKERVTQIEIAVPEVSVLGYSIGDNYLEFENYLSREKYEKSKDNTFSKHYEKGAVGIWLVVNNEGYILQITLNVHTGLNCG